MGDRRDRFRWQDGDVEVHQPPPSGLGTSFVRSNPPKTNLHGQNDNIRF
jgi:hypothetical protein